MQYSCVHPEVEKYSMGFSIDFIVYSTWPNTALEPTATASCAPSIVVIRSFIARPLRYFRGRGSALGR
jgi:hypothetical protein